jgi:hypothetical protein
MCGGDDFVSELGEIGGGGSHNSDGAAK